MAINDTAFVADYLLDTTGLSVGHHSVIGRSMNDALPAVLGHNVRIGRFCIIEDGVSIGDYLEMDDYCAVYSGAMIGSHVKLLYSKKIYSGAKVGARCIIGGNVPERCVIEDDVTFMGEVAHSHYNPTRDWDTTDEPSPVIGRGSIIGVNALIVGGVSVGHNCYVSAGEILRHDLEPGKVFLKGCVHDLSLFRGLIRTRYNEEA